MHSKRELLIAMLAIAISQPSLSQSKSGKPRYFELHTVSSSIRQIVTALGDRVQRPGKERLVINGTLNRQGTVSALTVVREMPGYLRVDEAGGKNKSLVFDLKDLKGQAAIDDDDEDLAETIEGDTAETFLAQLSPGATVRRLGDRFRVKGETGFGSEVDIYEVVGSGSLKRDKQVIGKHYMFDSSTGLLRRVSYATKLLGRTVRAQTVLSNYSQVGGYALPGRIVRIVDGSEVLAFTRTSATIVPAAADTTFTLVPR